MRQRKTRTELEKRANELVSTCEEKDDSGMIILHGEAKSLEVDVEKT